MHSYKILSKFIHLFWRYWRKHIFTSIKGLNAVVYNKFSPFAIPNHSSLISMSMQSLKKIGQKLLKLKSPETTFLHQSRTITLLFINKFSPFAIPNHSPPNINVHAKFEENRSKSTQVRVQKRSADRWTADRQTRKIFGGYNITPRHTKSVAGYNNRLTPFRTYCIIYQAGHNGRSSNYSSF